MTPASDCVNFLFSFSLSSFLICVFLFCLGFFFFSFSFEYKRQPILLSSFEETVYSPVLFKFLFINIFLHTMTASWVLTQLGLNSEGGGRGRGVPEKQK